MLGLSSQRRISQCILSRSAAPGQPKKNAEKGQALIEGVVVLLALLSLWVAIPWLSRFQDIALQASHASRFAAFSMTRNRAAMPVQQIREHYFSGPAHQWADRRGQALLSLDKSEVSLKISAGAALAAQAQPGGSAQLAQLLRSDWRLEDSGIINAHVSVALPAFQVLATPAASGSDSIKAGISQFDKGYPVVSRHTAILAGAGHASSDTDTQIRVSESGLGWSDSAQRSYALGRKIESRMAPVDQAWGRPAPVFDWLLPWAAEVPEFHIGNHPGEPLEH
jgi:hypothetical protein